MTPRAFFVGFAFGVLTCAPALVIGACTPSGRAELAPLVKPVERISCIVLRALSTSGGYDEICATADELAPYVSDLLASRGDTPRAAESRMSVAFVAPAPARPVARRRCAEWLPVVRDAGISADGGGDAGR